MSSESALASETQVLESGGDEITAKGRGGAKKLNGGKGGGGRASRAANSSSEILGDGELAPFAKGHGKKGGGGGGKLSNGGGKLAGRSGLHAKNATGPGLMKTATRVAALLRLSAKMPVIRNSDDIATLAAAVANSDRELLFTTVTMDKSLIQLVFLRQWIGNLRGAAAHTFMLGSDKRTCDIARNASVPCFIDGAAPALRGKQNEFGHQVLLKWWYAKELLALNYHLVFSDPDIAWLSDPFSFGSRTRSFDLQGLSDIRSTNLTTQKDHEIICIRPWMEKMYEHGRRSIYPCQSTGLWYMRDRPQSRAMMEGLYGYLYRHPNEWEQKAFQLIVMRYLVGLGDDLPPVRYRLLPTSHFINIEFYEERIKKRMETQNTIAVHCGYLKGMGDKFEHLEMNGFLKRGLAHHRRLYQSVVALGESGHGETIGDKRLYGHDETTVGLSLRRKNHSAYQVAVRRRA